MHINRAFLTNVSTLMSGTVLAQAITFAASFLLTRLYAPSDFGHYSIFIGYAGVLGAASTGAFDRLILLGRSEQESRRAATAALLFSMLAAAFVSVLGAVLGLLGLATALPLSTVELMVFVPMFMLCYAGAQVFTYAGLRHDRIRRLATLKVAQSSIMALVQILASFIRGIPGLMVGAIVGWSIMMVAGVRWRLSRGRVAEDLSRRALESLIRRNWRYPRYVMPNELLDSLSNQIPLFLIGTLFALSTAGHYGLALMMLSAPAAVLGQAVGQIFMQHIGRHGDDAFALRHAMFRIWGGMALIGVIPFAIVFAFGPTIFAFAFGEKWAEAGLIAGYLAPLLLARFVSSPTSTIYLKLNLQREQWWFVLAAMLYRTGCYGIAAFHVELKTVIFAHVVIEMVAIVLYNLVALRRLGRETRTTVST